MLLSWVELQSYVYNEKSLGLRQQLCGVPVLPMSYAETFFPIPTSRKNSIQFQLGVGTPRSTSLDVSFIGLIVLKAEL